MRDELRISIPCDNDGFVLLRCPKCGEYFKLVPSEYEDEAVESISCPQCGLISDSYITQDVIDLAMAKTTNMVNEMLNDAFKELERATRKGMIKIKTTKAKKVDEIPVRSSIEAFETIKFECCGRRAKLRSILAYCGAYCSYCGGLQDGNN
jgi:predicted  nucleic acid-binding Zn-ribbon protein